MDTDTEQDENHSATTAAATAAAAAASRPSVSYGRRLLDLSDELLLTIFSHLDIFSLFACRKTCRRLDRIGKDASLGRSLVLPCLALDKAQSLLQQMLNLFSSRLQRIEVKNCIGVSFDTIIPFLPSLPCLRSLILLSRIEPTRSLISLFRACPVSLENLQVGTISGFVRDEDVLALTEVGWHLNRLRTLDLSVHVVQNLHEILFCIRSPLEKIVVRTTVSHSELETNELLRQWSMVRYRIPSPTHVRFWIDSPNYNCRIGYAFDPLEQLGFPRNDVIMRDSNDFLFRSILGTDASILTSLQLEHVTLTPSELNLLLNSNFTKLRYLAFSPSLAVEPPWEDRIIRWLDSILQRCEELSTLRLDNVAGVDQLALPYRSSSTRLRVLDLGVNEGITPRLWSFTGPKLMLLDSPLDALNGNNPLSMDLSDTQFYLTNLRWFCLRTSKLSLYSLSESLGPQLVSLQVIFSDFLTDVDLGMIVRKWPRLEELALLSTGPAKVSDDGIASLGGLSNLRVLRLHNMALVRTGEGFVRLSAHCQKLEELSLAYTGAIGDSSILFSLPNAISAWTGLRTIRLIQPRFVVRESFYAALNNLHNLTHVSLTGAGMEHYVQSSIDFFKKKSSLLYLRVGMIEQVRRVELRHESRTWTQARHTPTEIFECWSHLDNNLFYQLPLA